MTRLNALLSSKWLIAITITALIVELAWFDASLLTVARLTLLAFWFAAVPGALTLAIALRKGLRSWDTWVFGTALGLNLLPVLHLLASFVTSDATIAWPIIGGIVSALNIALYSLYRKRTPSVLSKTDLPFALILIAVSIFLALFQFQQFGRDSANGIYYFSAYFGGDIPSVSSLTECFQRFTSPIDWHSGGASLAYHDATFRFLAGLRFFGGGDLYDTTWFFAQPFEFLLLLCSLWLLTFRLMQSKLAAWIATLGILLFDNAGKLEIFFTTISDSYRLGLVQGLLAIFLLTEYHSRPDTKQKRDIAALLLLVLAFIPRWKATGVMVLVPALLVAELVRARKTREWSAALIVAAGFAVALTHALILFSPSVALAGETVLGRPLLRVNGLGDSLLFHSWKLTPVFPLSSLSLQHVMSFLYLMPIYLVATCTDSMRLLIVVFLYPLIDRKREDHAYLATLFVGAAVIGQLLPVLQSPMHYVYGDAYQPIYGLVIGSIGGALVITRALESIKQRQHGSYQLLAFVILFAVGIELLNGVHGYHHSATRERGSIPITLLEQLEAGGARLPTNALVATRRYDVTGTHHDAPLAMHPHDSSGYHDRNFMFYGTHLQRAVVMEGPAGAMMRSGAIVETDSAQWYFPNSRLRSELICKSALLDSIYDSGDPEQVLAACDSLSVTHVLIDKSIGQNLRSTRLLPFDTIYDGKLLTLIRLRHPSIH